MNGWNILLAVENGIGEMQALVSGSNIDQLNSESSYQSLLMRCFCSALVVVLQTGDVQRFRYKTSFFVTSSGNLSQIT